MSGSKTRLSGAITITPPLTHEELRGLPAMIGPSAVTYDITTTKHEINTVHGPRRYFNRTASRIVPTDPDGPVRTRCDIESDVQRHVALFPGREFTGYISAQDEETGDVWQLHIRDGQVVLDGQVEPEPVELQAAGIDRATILPAAGGVTAPEPQADVWRQRFTQVRRSSEDVTRMATPFAFALLQGLAYRQADLQDGWVVPVELAQQELEHAETVARRMQGPSWDLDRRGRARPVGTARRRVVCLCGSTRFWAQFVEANRDETLAGNIVLSVGVDMRTMPIPAGLDQDEVKQQLDQLHLDKIAQADEVLVINPGGYIGSSTRNEIAYARRLGKPVRYLVQPEHACRVCGCTQDNACPTDAPAGAPTDAGWGCSWVAADLSTGTSEEG
jgi:hypothetical protein